MWIISGPFDGELGGEMNFQKGKLLKPSTSYTVGRKAQPLIVNNKKVSAAQCQFVVGEHSVDDVSDPSVKPLLRLINLNKKDKGLTITRGGKAIEVAPATEDTLQDGDMVALISGILVTVHWRPLCAYATPSLVPVEQCAPLGIKLVHAPHEGITHHVTSDFVASLSSMSSLLSLCQFVKAEWLQEVIKLGTDLKHPEPFNLSSLEEHFVLPTEGKYRPKFSPSLLPPQKTLRLWEPNEERVNLFQTCRFICLHEKVRELDRELREAIHRGGGSLERFDIHSGVAKFRRALTRAQGKEGKKTVIIGDEEPMRLAVGKETWDEYIVEARRSSLYIFPPSKFIQSVLDVNVDILLESNTMDVDEYSNRVRTTSPLTNTLAEGQSGESPQPATGPPRRKLIRRATSREPSAAPSVPEPAPEPPKPPRKTLTRRAIPKKPPVITGIDDPSEIIDSAPDLSSVRQTNSPPPATPAHESVGMTAPTPGRPKNLKRRFAGKEKSSALPQISMLSSIGETVPEEPPLKKFKALFEASGAETSSPMELESFNGQDSVPPFSSGLGSQTQTEVESEPARYMRGVVSSSLAVLREEEEETQGSSAHRRSSKRRFDEEADVEMQLVEDRQPSEASSGQPVSKRRAVENVNAVEKNTRGTSKPPSSAGPAMLGGKQGYGAAPGKPDTDAAFLKAIASTKRGKKTEDDFDREFNKLKISKPQLDRQGDPEEDWDVLADFGDDSGLRGNFMVVVEMDVYTKDSRDKENRTSNQAWEGKPNFKKFKKKVTNLSRPKIDLFISDENDYGTWAGGDSQPQTQTQTQLPLPESQMKLDVQPSRAQTQRKPRNGKSQITALPEDSDDDLQPLPPRQTRKAPSRAGSAAPAPSQKPPTAAKRKAPVKGKAKAQLFLDSNDDEIQDLPAQDGVTEEETLKSSPDELRAPARRTSRTTAAVKSKLKKAAPIIVDDDSDDDAVFKGFRGKRGGR